MMMMLLVHGPHSTQQGLPDPTLRSHRWLAMAVLSDSIYCDTLSPGNNLTNSSKTMVLYWDSLLLPRPPTRDTGKCLETCWVIKRHRVLLESTGKCQGCC